MNTHSVPAGVLVELDPLNHRLLDSEQTTP
jgi:hypothetical protein